MAPARNRHGPTLLLRVGFRGANADVHSRVALGEIAYVETDQLGTAESTGEANQKEGLVAEAERGVRQGFCDGYH
jgi:hypothetical protein